MALTDNVLAVEGVSADGEEYGWSVRVEAPDAPVGEYLLFQSPSPPTSLAALAGFDAAPCSQGPSTDPRVNCAVPGVGAYVVSVTRVLPGELSLTGGYAANTWGRATYFTLVRRGESTSTFDVAISVTSESGASDRGCGDPDPPGLRKVPTPPR